jgi:tyrosinase
MAFGMRRTVAWLLVLLTLSSWCLFTHASVTGNKHRHLLVGKSTGAHRRQANATSFIAVTGIGYLADDVAIHPRLEIRELERRPDEFNVFLLGLRRWMETSQNQKESYFQIAGKEISAQTSSVMVSELA